MNKAMPAKAETETGKGEKKERKKARQKQRKGERQNEQMNGQNTKQRKKKGKTKGTDERTKEIKKRKEGLFVCWYFEPSHPQKITLRLKTNFGLPSSYSLNK